MLNGYLPEIGAVCVGALVIAASFMAGKALHEEAPIEPCTGEDAYLNTCWREYYEGVLVKGGSAAALKDLKGRYEGGEPAATYCHPILHQIGAFAAAEYGSVEEAYNHGETFCRAGYYHGVLEGIFGSEGGEGLLEKLDSICSRIPGKERYSYNYFSCVHGIGHGLMAYFDHDLFETIRGCDRLSGEWEQSSCAGGAFMENIISSTPEMPSRFLSDDPHYPCNAVDEKYRPQCYLMQTSHMLTLFEGDFAKTFEACSQAEEKYRITCFESLGRDASGWSYGDAERAIALCAEGRTLEERGHCYLGAASDFIQSVGGEGARALCAQAEDGTRVQCIQRVEVQIGAL